MKQSKESIARASESPALVRVVGLFGLTAISLNGVIGSGIFVLPATVALLLGAASPVAYVVAALVVALIVLCFAEVGSRFEQTGGPYLYAREAFGRFAGFLVGWMFLLSRLAAGAAISDAFARYLGYFWQPLGSGGGRALVITALLALLAGLNVAGVRYGAWVVNLLTVAKLLPLLLFVGVGLFFVDGSRVEFLTIPDMGSLRQASLALIFAFGGFENASIPTEEVKDPRRSLPVALLLCVAVTAALYILIQVVALGTLPGLATDPTPLASAGGVFLGAAGAALITLGAVLSTTGSNSALTLVGPRIFYALAQGRQLPAALARIHARFRTPHVAIVTFALVVWVMAMVGNFAELVAVSAMARLLFSATTCLSVPVLRRKLKGMPTVFRLPGGALIPLLAAAICVWLLAGINRTQAIAGGVALVMGAALYLVFGRGAEETDKSR